MLQIGVMAIISNEIYKKTIALFFSPQVAGQETQKKQIDFALEIHTGSNGRKEMLLRLTDKSDPFFLHQLILNEEDFADLKSQQGILVDYSSFPPKLTELFELCLAESHSEAPKFLLKFQQSCLSDGKATLSIVEATQFRHLVHLSLVLSLANDCEVKKYLATCLSKLQQERATTESSLRTTIRDLEARLSQCQTSLENTCHELSVLRADLDSRVSQMEAKFSQQMASAQEKHLKEKSQLQNEVEARRIERESFFQTSLGQFEDRVKSLEGENKELVEKKYKNEASIRDLKSKLEVCDCELQRFKSEISNIRNENTALSNECHEKEKAVHNLKTKIAVLEQDVKSKSLIIQRSQEQVEMANQQRVKSDDNTELLKNKVSELEQNLKHASDDNSKANDIIRKLQEDLRLSYGKLKLKNSVTIQQEKLVSEKTGQLEKTEAQLKVTEAELHSCHDQVAKLREDLKNANSKLEENQKILDSNEKIIQYLNKQITDSQLSHRSSQMNFGNSSNVISKFGANNVQNTSRGGGLQAASPTNIQSPNHYQWNSTHHTYNSAYPGVGNNSTNYQDNYQKTYHNGGTPLATFSASPGTSPRDRFPASGAPNVANGEGAGESLPSKYLKSSNVINLPKSSTASESCRGVGDKDLMNGLGLPPRRSSASDDSRAPVMGHVNAANDLAQKQQLAQTQMKIHNMSIASTAHSTSSKANGSVAAGVSASHKTPVMSAYFMPPHAQSNTYKK